MLFVPQYGYQAAALTTIASELMLLIPFGVFLHQALGALPWFQMIWRPVLAAALMLVTLLLTGELNSALGLTLGVLVYVAVLVLLRPLNSSEIERLRPLLPGRLRKLVRS
jgi:O-antigen/teichoic acid export membrane protein